ERRGHLLRQRADEAGIVLVDLPGSGGDEDHGLAKGVLGGADARDATVRGVRRGHQIPAVATEAGIVLPDLAKAVHPKDYLLVEFVAAGTDLHESLGIRIAT